MAKTWVSIFWKSSHVIRKYLFRTWIHNSGELACFLITSLIGDELEVTVFVNCDKSLFI